MLISQLDLFDQLSWCEWRKQLEEELEGQPPDQPERLAERLREWLDREQKYRELREQERRERRERREQRLEGLEGHLVKQPSVLESAAPISFYFDLDNFSPTDIVDIIAWLSELYADVGGDGLVIDDVTLLDFQPSLLPTEV